MSARHTVWLVPIVLLVGLFALASWMDHQHPVVCFPVHPTNGGPDHGG